MKFEQLGKTIVSSQLNFIEKKKIHKFSHFLVS